MVIYILVFEFCAKAMAGWSPAGAPAEIRLVPPAQQKPWASASAKALRLAQLETAE